MARDLRFAELEDELRRVPGIRNARIAGEETPTEIHIVATAARPAKQLVRDVQSLASAGFGIPIDHRIVSVVQLEETTRLDPPPPPEVTPSSRPVLERVALVSKEGKAWINIVLRWADGTTTQAVSTAEVSRDARARAAVGAVLRALDPVLKSRRATLEMNHVVVQELGTQTTVVVAGTYMIEGSATDVSGSAVVHDDVATAAVHATLHAINRKLG
jgi:hypothetical protein